MGNDELERGVNLVLAEIEILRQLDPRFKPEFGLPASLMTGALLRASRPTARA
jgi:hypothetical protein